MIKRLFVCLILVCVLVFSLPVFSFADSYGPFEDSIASIDLEGFDMIITRDSDFSTIDEFTLDDMVGDNAYFYAYDLAHTCVVALGILTSDKYDDLKGLIPFESATDQEIYDVIESYYSSYDKIETYKFENIKYGIIFETGEDGSSYVSYVTFYNNNLVKVVFTFLNDITEDEMLNYSKNVIEGIRYKPVYQEVSTTKAKKSDSSGDSYSYIGMGLGGLIVTTIASKKKKKTKNNNQ